MRGLVRWVKKFTPGFPVSEDITTGQIISSLRESQISTFFNLVFPLWEEETKELNLFNRDLCREIPEAVPFGSLHIETPDKGPETRRCLEDYGFYGMKLHPYAQRFPAFGKEMAPMFDVLDQLERPLLVHTGFDVFYGMYMDLEDMEAAIRDYPGMQVVAVHALFPRFQLAYRLLSEYPNFWLDMTNTISCIRLYKGMKDSSEQVWQDSSSLETDLLQENLEAFYLLFEDFPERIMYGTDFPVGFGYHPGLLDDLLFFGFPDQTADMVLGGAVRRLLDRCGLPASFPG
jgi:predicted TIM-barrel fold metal-dependent hydrolase